MGKHPQFGGACGLVPLPAFPTRVGARPKNPGGQFTWQSWQPLRNCRAFPEAGGVRIGGWRCQREGSRSFLPSLPCLPTWPRRRRPPPLPIHCDGNLRLLLRRSSWRPPRLGLSPPLSFPDLVKGRNRSHAAQTVLLCPPGLPVAGARRPSRNRTGWGPAEASPPPLAFE